MKAALSETKYDSKSETDPGFIGSCSLSCRVPALKVTHDDETNEVSVDVCDDPFQYGVLDVSNLPVFITVGQVGHS